MLLSGRLLAATVDVLRRGYGVSVTMTDVVRLGSELVCLGSCPIVVRAGMQPEPLARRAEHEDERP